MGMTSIIIIIIIIILIILYFFDILKKKQEQASFEEYARKTIERDKLRYGTPTPEGYDSSKEIPNSGFGSYTFGNGITYEGNWKDSLKHGEGKEMDSTGNIILEGIWEKGVHVSDDE